MGIPVTVYKSTDVDAPQLSGGRGDLKTVIKACLAAGFGSGVNRKEPLGWQIVAGTESADGFDCAFRPTAPDSGGHIIKIIGTSTQSATVQAFFDTDASGALIEQTPTVPDFPVWVQANRPIDWILVGHHRSFILLLHDTGITGDDNNVAGGTGAALFFGEMPDRINNPRGNTLFFRIYSNQYTFGRAYMSIADFWDGKYSYISQSVDGLTKWVQTKPHSMFGVNCVGFSPINSELVYTKIGMTSGGAFRGFLPFGYHVHHRLPASENWKYKTIDGVEYLLTNCSNGQTTAAGWGEGTVYMLINLTEWDC